MRKRILFLVIINNNDLFMGENYMEKRCSNCSQQGHTFKNCKGPILSVGIIPIFKNSKNILLVQRQHTIAFTDIIRNRLPIFNIKLEDKLKILINEITKEECLIIKNNDYDFEILWKYIWGKSINKRKREHMFAKRNWESNQEVLKLVLKNYIPNYTKTEYSFPKGRKQIKETLKECASREFKEETSLDDSKYIILDTCIEEEFIATNGIVYKHLYYFGIINENIDEKNIIDSFQENEEVKKLISVDSARLLNIFRIYETSKQKIIKNINEFINSYFLIN